MVTRAPARERPRRSRLRQTGVRGSGRRLLRAAQARLAPHPAPCLPYRAAAAGSPRRPCRRAQAALHAAVSRLLGRSGRRAATGGPPWRHVLPPRLPWLCRRLPQQARPPSIHRWGGRRAFSPRSSAGGGKRSGATVSASATGRGCGWLSGGGGGTLGAAQAPPRRTSSKAAPAGPIPRRRLAAERLRGRSMSEEAPATPAGAGQTRDDTPASKPQPHGGPRSLAGGDSDRQSGGHVAARACGACVRRSRRLRGHPPHRAAPGAPRTSRHASSPITSTMRRASARRCSARLQAAAQWLWFRTPARR